MTKEIKNVVASLLREFLAPVVTRIAEDKPFTKV